MNSNPEDDAIANAIDVAAFEGQFPEHKLEIMSGDGENFGFFKLTFKSGEEIRVLWSNGKTEVEHKAEVEHEEV